jgi:hypothetical protein
VTVGTQIFELLSEIPATFWGVLAGSALSLGGVLLQNRATEKRLRSQFLHEHELRRRDRELALRKDVYLDVAEAISIAISTITNFANFDIPNDDVMGKYREKVGTVAKVQVIGTEATLKSLSSFMGAVNSAIFQLTPIRVGLVRKKQEIATLDVQINKGLQEQGRWLEMLKQYNLEGKIDPPKWNAIESNYKFETGRLDELTKNRHESLKSLQVEQLAFLGQCVEESLKVIPFLPSLISAVRVELDIPISEPAIANIFGANAEQLRTLFEDLQEKIRVLTESAAQ